MMAAGRRTALVGALSIVVLTGTIRAQEFRSTISGRVVDTSGAGVPAVAIEVRHEESTAAYHTTSTEDGSYVAAFLPPGRYVVRAAIPGFQPFVSNPVDVPVAETLTLTIRLAIEGVREGIAVSAVRFDAAKPDRGASIDQRKLSELPLNGRNPFMLATLAAGITFNGPMIFQRPFDNGAIADWSISGGLNRNNEFLLDGAPNNAIHGGNNIAYVPPVDAVQEFRIVTNGYDAQYGRTGGGIVNVSLKSGTDVLHGTTYEFARRGAWDAGSFIENARGGAETGHYLDQYGFELDGPVRIGSLYDGRGRTFFMASVEGYREGTPTPMVHTVPDEAQRRGDFSGLRDASGNPIAIFDPASGRIEHDEWVRDPFPGNIIPEDRIDPIARQLLAYYPRPNTVTLGSDAWRHNLEHAPNLARDTFVNLVTKVDHAFGDGHRAFVRYATNRRRERRHRNGITSGAAQDGQHPLTRSNHAAVADWVRALGRDVLVNVRASANRYVNDVRIREAEGFDLTRLGFPSALRAALPQALFPRINIADYAPLGRGASTRLPTTVAALQPNVTIVRGGLSLRAGLDARWTWYAPVESGFASMRLDFDRGFTQRAFDRPDPRSGNAVASLLLGAPVAGVVDVNIHPAYRWSYYAPWLQQDWRVAERLTLNAGLRWDISSPVTERDNRLNHGFDLENGALVFAGLDGAPRAAHRFDWNNVQPRAGAVYVLDERTLIRGGYGRFFLNPTTVGTSHGFSVQTVLVPSVDGHRTSTHALSNPFPAGIAAPADRPSAAALLGRSPRFSNPAFVVPSVDQFSFGIVRELPWRLSVDASYVGSRTHDAPSTWSGINEPGLAMRNRCDPTRGGSPSFCSEQLPNPYFGAAGFEGTLHHTSPTLSRYDLARPYPQFAPFAELDRNDGRVWYDALQVSSQKRLSDAVSFSATYTLSRTIEQSGFRDDVARLLDRSPAATDRPHRLTASFVYAAPEPVGGIGRALGGWIVAGTFIAQSGRPWDLPENVWYVGDAPVRRRTNGRYLAGVSPCVGEFTATGETALLPAAAASGCTRPSFVIRPQYSGRTTPFRDASLRLPGFRQVDVAVSRVVRLRERLRLQLRAEVFNLLNEPSYDERQYVSDPYHGDFGRINRDAVPQSNFPRHVQLAVKLLF